MCIINSSDVTKNDVLEYLENCDSIDITHIQTIIMENKRKKYLDMHPYSIYQGKDGRWVTYLPDKRKRRKVSKKTKKEVEDIVIDFWKENSKTITIEILFNQWNDERLELKEISKGTYDRHKETYERHYAEIATNDIREMTTYDWIYFLKKEKADKDLKKKAVDNLITTIKGIIYTAKRQDKLPFNMGDFFDELTIVRKSMKFEHPIKEDCQEVFDEDEYARFLEYLRNNLDSTNIGILLMFITGMRVGEVVALKNEDVLNDSIIVRRTETRSKDDTGYHYSVKDFPKSGNGWRRVVIPKDYQFLLQKMKLLNPFGEYVFMNYHGERMTTNSIRRRQMRICDKLKIYRKSPHKARKTVATILFDQKIDNNMIVGQMGWSSVAVGETHYHRNRKTIDAKIDILSSIPELSF